MARIRTIKPEFWGDEKLAPCSPMTRLVFLGLISMADDAGRVVDNVKVIDAFIFPETSETCRGSVDELSAMGRIRRGKTASGQRIIEITNWSAHQKIEKPNLRAAFPEIVATKEVAEIPRPVGEASGNDRGSVGEASSNHTNDLRPSTNDRRPTTDDPLPRGGKAAPWMGEVRSLWVGRFDADPPTSAPKVLRPLVAAHGIATVIQHLGYWLDRTDPKYLNLHRFAATFGEWAPKAPRGANGLNIPDASVFDRLGI